MNFNKQTDEELKALHKAIEEELWRRDKVGKQQHFYVAYPYRAEHGGAYATEQTYLDKEEAINEAYSYMVATYGKDNFEYCGEPGRYTRLDTSGGELVDTRIISEWF